MKKTLIMIGAMTLCAMPAFANERHFNEADTNCDGMISRAEHATMADKLFTKADTNGDGMLSQQETMAMHKTKWSKHKTKRGTSKTNEVGGGANDDSNENTKGTEMKKE